MVETKIRVLLIAPTTIDRENAGETFLAPRR